MPTKRRPRRVTAKAKIVITPDIVAAYIDLFDELWKRNDDDGFGDAYMAAH